MIHAVWAEWWLRPVSRDARVGEHRAVVWKWLYLRPFFASASRVGVLQGPPKVLLAPKPTSSSRISRTLGAPLGACTGCGKSDFESLARRLIVPLNGGGGGGRTVPATASGFFS